MPRSVSDRGARSWTGHDHDTHPPSAFAAEFRESDSSRPSGLLSTAASPSLKALHAPRLNVTFPIVTTEQAGTLECVECGAVDDSGIGWRRTSTTKTTSSGSIARTAPSASSATEPLSPEPRQFASAKTFGVVRADTDLTPSFAREVVVHVHGSPLAARPSQLTLARPCELVTYSRRTRSPRRTVPPLTTDA